MVSRNQLDTWIRDAANPQVVSDSDVGLPSETDQPQQTEISMDENTEAAEDATEQHIEASEDSYIDTDFGDDDDDAEPDTSDAPSETTEDDNNPSHFPRWISNNNWALCAKILTVLITKSSLAQ